MLMELILWNNMLIFSSLQGNGDESFTRLQRPTYVSRLFRRKSEHEIIISSWSEPIAKTKTKENKDCFLEP